MSLILLTPPELARELRMATQTLADWRYRRLGPRYIKRGGRVLYRRDDVDRWIESQAVDPQSLAPPLPQPAAGQ